MNLAHSVALCLYEVNKTKGELSSNEQGRKQLASNEILEQMYSHMQESLTRVGFLNPQNPEHIMRAFRRVLGRSALNEREVRIMRGLFSQIDLLDDQMQELRSAESIDG